MDERTQLVQTYQTVVNRGKLYALLVIRLHLGLGKVSRSNSFRFVVPKQFVMIEIRRQRRLNDFEVG